MTKSLIFYCLLLFELAGSKCYAQIQTNSQRKTTPYYIDFNSTSKSSVFEIQSDLLNIQYRDIYGSAKLISFTVYNWKSEKVTDLNLTKEFGLNHFEIDLSKHIPNFSRDEIYTCQLKDEKGKIYEAIIKQIDPLKREISLEILVKPVLLECGNPIGENLVEFYGSIDGGKAPYEVRWYVLNKARTSFLYQPKEITIDRPGSASSIQVDQSPEYFVLLFVKDACGNEQKQTVLVTCEAGQKKINTVFLEYIDGSPLSNKSTSHN